MSDPILGLSWYSGFPANSVVHSLLLTTQSGQQKILAVGSFASYRGISTPNVVRLNATGSIDSSFIVGSGANGIVRSVASQVISGVQKYIIAGDFTEYDGLPANRIARINNNGTIDVTFGPIDSTGFNGTVSRVVVDTNNQILVTGNFSDYNGDTVTRIARLTVDGELDASFDVGTGLNAAATAAVALDFEDSVKYVVGGYFTNYNSTAVNRVVRIHSNGDVDASFAIGTGFNSAPLSFKTVGFGDDQRLLVGGSFTSYNGNAANYVVMLGSNGSVYSAFANGSVSGNVTAIASQDVELDQHFVLVGSFANCVTRIDEQGNVDSDFIVSGPVTSLVNDVVVRSDGVMILGGNIASYNSDSNINTLIGLLDPQLTPLPGTQVTYQVITVGGVTEVPEGNSVSFAVTTTGVADGTILYWDTQSVSGSVASSDFSDNRLSGNVTIVNSTGVISRSVSADSSTEGTESFRIRLRSGSVTGPILAVSPVVYITDISLDPLYSGFYAEGTVILVENPVVRTTAPGTPDLYTIQERWYKVIDPAGIDLSEIEDLNSIPDRLLPISDPRIPKRPAKLIPRIGFDPNNPDRTGPGLGPPRVAKFIVDEVDAEGAISKLRLIDRGLYKVFPSDLTEGVPLEYDFESNVQNRETNNMGPPRGTAVLGLNDPQHENILYGSLHPDYMAFPERRDAAGNRLVGTRKHPGWVKYTEYRATDPSVEYFGTPGAYDPGTMVEIVRPVQDLNREITDESGNVVPNPNFGQQLIVTTDAGLEPVFETVRLSKEYAIDLDDPENPESYGKYRFPLRRPGGTGARIFVTAQDVLDCSEVSTAREILNLPERIEPPSLGEVLTDAINSAFAGAGYNPRDINVEVRTVGTGIDGVSITSPIYDGIRIDGPGILDPLGLPRGDYIQAALCVQATLSTTNISDAAARQQIENMYNTVDPTTGVSAYGLLGNDELTRAGLLPTLPDGLNSVPDISILSILCADAIDEFPAEPPGGPLEPIKYYNDMFRYSLVNLDGNPVHLRNGVGKQNVNVNVFESKRFSNVNLNGNSQLTVEQVLSSTGIASEPKAWVDDYLGNGWAYLEYGTVVRSQEPLVDVNYVRNSMLYDQETGAKESDLHAWDPFKGVIPGFLRNEIAYISPEDPVTYNSSRTGFGENNVGKLWWDTSTLRYTWYEQGTSRERWKNWGKIFPGSTITICEWVESRALPQNWNGDGTPRYTNQYVTERRIDPATNQYVNFYYYWVQNRTQLEPRARRRWKRTHDAQQVARYISNPVGYGIPLISFVDDHSFVLSNTKQQLREDDSILQINLQRNLNPDGFRHTAWKLLREGDVNSTVPDHLTSKLIDSLCGENAIGQPVPDERLSEVERYGIEFRPRQTMFRNIHEARRTFVYKLNMLLADLKVNTDFTGWDTNLPALSERQYIKTVNWYGIQRTDGLTNEVIRYDASFKPVYKIRGIGQLDTLKGSPDGTVIQVDNSSASKTSVQLWIYHAGSDSFELIAVNQGTVQLSDAVYTDATNSVMAAELRSLLTALYTNVFAGTDRWNSLFFEMLKYAYLEQQQLSWAFKTSYLYVQKNEQDLVLINGFKPDNFEPVIEYMNEVKPYSSKIRTYRDGKSAPMDVMGQNSISDYDKPPYADPVLGRVRTLDDFDQGDTDIMASLPQYADYLSAFDKDQDPIRRIRGTINIDRTNWRLTEPLYDDVTDVPGLYRSISRNINTLISGTYDDLADYRAADRIFLYDPEVKEQYASDVMSHYPTWIRGAEYGLVPDYTQIPFWTSGAYDTGDQVLYLGLYYQSKIDSNTSTPGSADWVRLPDFKNLLPAGDRPIVRYTNGTDVALYIAIANITATQNQMFNLIDSETGDVLWTRIEAPYTEIADGTDAGAERVYCMLMAGTLRRTIELVKTKVGAGFRGEELDADVFTNVIYGMDGTSDYITSMGYDTTKLDSYLLDQTIDVINYEGVFNEATQGAVTLRRNGLTYEGFDGVTFSRVLYGEERPEELVQISPLESLIIRVTTAANANIANSETVTFQMHQNMFGDTEYLRVDANVSTTLAANVYTYSDEIKIVDGSILAVPTLNSPGVVWIGTERITYERLDSPVDGSWTLRMLTRATSGTTREDWPITNPYTGNATLVIPGHAAHTFNHLDPDQAIWTDINAVSLSDAANANVSDTQSIMKFLHNR